MDGDQVAGRANHARQVSPAMLPGKAREKDCIGKIACQ